MVRRRFAVSSRRSRPFHYILFVLRPSITFAVFTVFTVHTVLAVDYRHHDKIYYDPSLGYDPGPYQLRTCGFDYQLIIF